ncbi:phosphoribosylglycinamide formyltransferase [Alkalihalobacillus sp. AL-G]|uniref:phosphoribosylglycinamide formyltransferase n=1 Tax=Alkalihalobacillus sp. AL-G TaxID=2926399 RepID=UPI00272CD9DB|nr:phosphoribosylglycinamide formyltransferase [Alkalihalobacillus sp. AL-G]WLD93737.1 phosphoribosylglycinamide formyltransferase [Alkalihalobacillus sp. AL-G]
MTKIAVFASGSGTNFQAILDAIDNGALHANVALLVCDKPGAAVIERAEKKNIPTFAFYPKEFPSKQAFESLILEELKQAEVQLVVLAGYMRLIGETLLSELEGKIINLHPSMLPAFPGKDAIGQALDSGVSETGVTVHFVDRGMDTGPIIEQKTVPIYESDTKEDLEQRIHKVEHELYPQVIQKLIQSKVTHNI